MGVNRVVSTGAAALAVVLGTPLSAVADDDDGPAAVLADITVTDEMRAAATFDLEAKSATFDLEAKSATFDLDGASATVTLETTETSDDQTSVTLTSDLLFEFGKSDLTEPARATLGDLAKEIPQDAVVAVDGHTDSVSGNDVNVPLSQDRAQAVADALAAARPDLVLTPTGHGSDDPVADNTNDDGSDNPVGRQLNRRVTLTYTTG